MGDTHRSNNQEGKKDLAFRFAQSFVTTKPGQTPCGNLIIPSRPLLQCPSSAGRLQEDALLAPSMTISPFTDPLIHSHTTAPKRKRTMMRASLLALTALLAASSSSTHAFLTPSFLPAPTVAAAPKRTAGALSMTGVERNPNFGKLVGGYVSLLFHPSIPSLDPSHPLDDIPTHPPTLNPTATSSRRLPVAARPFWRPTLRPRSSAWALGTPPSPSPPTSSRAWWTGPRNSARPPATRYVHERKGEEEKNVQERRRGEGKMMGSCCLHRKTFSLPSFLLLIYPPPPPTCQLLPYKK